MALSDSLVLDDVSGDDVTYSKIAPLGGGSRRIDVATTAASPAILAIKHSATGKGADAVDRHLVQFTRTLPDTNSVPRTLTVNFTVAIPRNAVITQTIVMDQIANLIDFLMSGGLTTLASTANIEALLRGEE